MNKNVLVAGGAGYIGSHTCKALARAGFTPIVYDDFSRGHRAACKFGPVVEGSVLDEVELSLALEKWNPCAVLHFAALAYVGESNENPAAYYHTNIAGSICLFNAMLGAGVKNLVFSSSCAIYGEISASALREDASKIPLSPYGRSKLMIERILADYDKAYRFPHVNLRYFNAAGADPDGELGECHEPETHLIPLAIEASLTGRDLAINGNDYETQDGTCVRDYIHVSDLADAHVLALKLLLDGGFSDSFNIGTGQGFSCLQIADEVARQTRMPRRVNFAPRRPGDAAILIADASKARDVLGWSPSLSTLDIIVKTALAWRIERKKHF